MNEPDSLPVTKHWQIQWREVFTLALWNLLVEIYQLKERRYIQGYKSTLKGKSRKFCLESVAANANVRGKFESLQTLFWIQSCLLVKTFSIGIKVSSRNWAAETFFDFHYLLWNVQRSLTSLHFQCWMKTKLIDFKPTVLRVCLVRWNRTVWSFHANNFLTYNFGQFHFLLAVLRSRIDHPCLDIIRI